MIRDGDKVGLSQRCPWATAASSWFLIKYIQVPPLIRSAQGNLKQPQSPTSTLHCRASTVRFQWTIESCFTVVLMLFDFTNSMSSFMGLWREDELCMQWPLTFLDLLPSRHRLSGAQPQRSLCSWSHLLPRPEPLFELWMVFCSKPVFNFRTMAAYCVLLEILQCSNTF